MFKLDRNSIVFLSCVAWTYCKLLVFYHTPGWHSPVLHEADSNKPVANATAVKCSYTSLLFDNPY